MATSSRAITLKVSSPISSKHSEIPNSCLPHKLLGVVDVGKVLVDGRRGDAKQLKP